MADKPEVADKYTPRFADRVRVHAMRLVTSIVNFSMPEPDEIIAGEWHMRSLWRPDPSEWGFIDMDPLIAPKDWYALSDNRYDAQWPVDHALALPMGEDQPRDFRISYCRTVSPKEVRGVANVFSPKMVKVGNMDFINGRYGCGGGLYTLFNGHWVPSIRETYTSRLVTNRGEKVDGAVAAHIGAALRHRYEWSVILNFPKCRARFSTDATGALAMFKDRNKDPLMGRRAPLMHWVSKHWRKRRDVTADMIEVRKHLRGRSDFEWRGFPVTIIPSEFEVERAVYGDAA